ncbi:MAG TPA: hypothetical protein VG847_13570 [Chitinophagaceae bacterium]|nr:hypothetical protein [Chitinophagaceae bacterium]
MQNRVDPMGNIIDTTARGGWMGNRGQLHDDTKTILRPFKLKAWLTCVLQFKSRKRSIMSPGLYTELFFLDEATAFAAGHRPCFECRRQDHYRFKMYWLKGNPEYKFIEDTSINKIDAILHTERINSKGNKVTWLDNIDNLPAGTFIFINSTPYLIAGNHLYHWTPSGYDNKIALIKNTIVPVLTPRSIVNTFSAGYIPQMAINDVNNG